MFHDFEEIIFIKPWLIKNKERLNEKVPKFTRKFASHYDSITTPSLALGIAGMFTLVSIVTITAILTGWYYLWFGTFIIFTIHLVVHCVPGIIFKGYVPAVVTSLICLPICCYLIVVFSQNYKPEMGKTLIFLVIGAIVGGAAFLLIHKCMRLFDKWLTKYQNRNSSA